MASHSSSISRTPVSSEKTDDVARFHIYINIHEAWSSWQAWDSHDITTDRVQETSSCTASNLANGDAESCWDSLGSGIATQTVLGLGNANRQTTKFDLFVSFDLLVCYVEIVDTIGAINFHADGLDHFLDAEIQLIQ
jgi:microcompartment protein CcmK/EutM